MANTWSISEKCYEQMTNATVLPLRMSTCTAKVREESGWKNHEFTSSLGHPKWDPKYPGKSDDAVKWDPVHEQEARDKKRAQAEVWNEDDIEKTLDMKNKQTRGQKIEL